MSKFLCTIFSSVIFLAACSPASESVKVNFPIYGLDENALHEEKTLFITLDVNLSLSKKVETLAEGLSQHKFSGLPIEFMSIKDQDAQKIARINLLESDETGASWQAGYFQGSAGGQATYLTLTKTLLQPDYVGDWIDGVEFYYEGNPMEPLDHLDLSGVIERSSF